MAEPRIRFFRAPTGHRVAFAVHGDGPPLVCSGWWVSHLERDWRLPTFRDFFVRLGQHFTVYRYDRPGTGLSDRDREHVDIAEEIDTLEALFDHAALSRASLFGLSCAGPTALGFARRHPERVDKIVLFGSFARGDAVAPAEVREAIQQLVRASWGLGAKVLTDLFDPNLDAAGRAALNEAQRASATGAMAAELLRLTYEADASDDARAATMPVFVAHRRGDRTIRFDAGRELAAEIPGATFCPLEGDAHVPWHGDFVAAADAVLSFLLPGDPPPTVSVDASRDEATEETSAKLVRRGDVWELCFAGESAHIKASRGLEDLAILLAHPGREIHARDLYQGFDPSGPFDPHGDDPALDREALAAYRARLEQIDRQLDTSEARERRERELRAERDAIVRELRASVGLGGRRRALDPAAERARKAVSARIRAALEKITLAHPHAGTHLAQRVATGNYCVFEPLPGDEAWAVRP